MSRFRPTLAQAFVVANLCLAALLGALVYGLYRGSERTVLATSELVRSATSALIGQRVQAYLEGADGIIDRIERQIQLGLCDPADPRSVEAALFAAALDHPDMAGISLTQGRPRGWGADGQMLLAGDGRSQVSVYRETDATPSPLTTAWVRREGGRFFRDERRRGPADGLQGASFERAAVPMVPDPTEALTFITPASRAHLDDRRPVWTDLSFVEFGAPRPARDRRVVVTAMRALRDRSGLFVGVARAGLRMETVDRIVWQEQERARPNQIVLCDEVGRLVARLAPGDAVLEQPDTSLRVTPDHVPDAIARALRDESLHVGPNRLEASGRFSEGGHVYLVSFRALAETQDWRVGVVVAEDELPGVAEQQLRQRRLSAFAILLSMAILVGGVLTLRAVRRSLDGIASSSGRMRDFDFAPASPRAFFRDMEAVLGSLELAKTAMRAMSKYVPVELVRTLYRTGREPQLGSELLPVTLLFSDIKGFTTLAERLPPTELAQVLGRYLEVMSAAIQARSGTIDKYIGDAIMAVWNAPTPCEDHPTRACEAALAAEAAAEALFRSPEWEGRPPLVTRFGVHTDEVLVGHFGAPDRMSYTCLGDGVNLAARLEGLNKQYGTTILVSDAVRQAASPGFAFRALDVVAVSGKGQAVRVHELMGHADLPGPRLETARAYEAAFADYLRRDFRAALVRLETQAADRPSEVLADRCRGLIENPPPDDWDGTYVATSK